jgi:2-methylisocitrate lyase-like PEP mutase family enzyme
VAGLSIEDSTGQRDRPSYELPGGGGALTAARTAIDASQTGTLLVGRAECYLTGHPDPLGESIRRLTAYADAGADVLYAPGVATRDDIAAIVSAVAPKPVNVVMWRFTGLTVADLAGLGVRRISVGGALARVAWTAFTSRPDHRPHGVSPDSRARCPAGDQRLFARRTRAPAARWPSGACASPSVGAVARRDSW